jgi:hypothetical protein
MKCLADQNSSPDFSLHCGVLRVGFIAQRGSQKQDKNSCYLVMHVPLGL